MKAFKNSITSYKTKNPFSKNRFLHLGTPDYFATFSTFMSKGHNSYASLKGDVDHVKIDQQKRADAIIEEAIVSNKDTIVTMDGSEGRFTFLLLRTAKKFNYKISIILVEINPIMHKLHCLNYARLDMVTPILMDVMDYKINSNELLYLNFCGIGASAKAVLHLIQNARYPFFLSYGDRSGIRSSVTDFRKIQMCLTKIKPISRRKIFVSYFVEKPIVLSAFEIESEIKKIKDNKTKKEHGYDSEYIDSDEEY